jgi:hypothetical protein
MKIKKNGGMTELEKKKLEELLRAMQKEIFFICKDILNSMSSPLSGKECRHLAESVSKTEPELSLEGTNPPG